MVVGADLRADLPSPLSRIPGSPRASTQVASPVESSPGDQANFDSSPVGGLPEEPVKSSVSPQPSPSWREPAGGAPTPPADVSVDLNGNGATPPMSPGGANEQPMSPSARSTYSQGTHGASFSRDPPPQGIMAKTMAKMSAATNRMINSVQTYRAKAAARAQGGKLLLQQLQDESGAKDPSLVPGIMVTPPPDPRYATPTLSQSLKWKAFGAPGPIDPATGRVEIPDPIAAKASVWYKMKGARRRTSQQMAVKVGKAQKHHDEDFELLWAGVQRQELLLNKIKADGKRLADAIKAQADAAKSMASHIASLAETSVELPEGPEAAARRQVVERAGQLMEIMDVMDQDVRPACLEQLSNSVNKPVGQLCEEFPAYQQCVDKRTHYMLDMDAYERKLQKARQFSKDPAKVPHREEQFTKAQRRYTYFSDKLVEDLTLLDANRYELAGFLIEGFVEMQEFQSQRQKDVLAGLSSNKLPPKE